MSEQPKTCMTDGEAVDPQHREINPATGMQKGYVVLCPEERAKGFVRPVRRSYKHVGVKPRGTIEMLEEPYICDCKTYVAVDRFELQDGKKAGTYLTKYEVEQVKKSGCFGGCGTVTTMGQALAETYARDPKFYSGTFCCGCGTHFPVAGFTWVPDGSVVGS